MQRRKGEKVGWTVGWIGGFLWLCLLSIIWLVQGKITSGVLGLVLFGVAILSILTLAPWRHPETRYWKLLLPIYAVLAAAFGLCIWLGGALDQYGLSWWSLLWLMPLFIPFATVGTRRWKDGNAQQTD